MSKLDISIFRNELTNLNSNCFQLKMPFLVLAFGNPLMDISITLKDCSILTKYGLLDDDQRELDSEVIDAILQDVLPR